MKVYTKILEAITTSAVIAEDAELWNNKHIFKEDKHEQKKIY